MTTSLSALAAAAAVAFALPALAVPRPSASRSERREERDERSDLAQLKTLASRFDVALARKDISALDAVDRELSRVVRAEIREGDPQKEHEEEEEREREAEEQARRKATNSHSASVDDPKHLKGEARRTPEDDEEAQERAARTRRVKIARDLETLAGLGDAPTVARKRSLLGDLIAELEREVAEDAKRGRPSGR